MAFAGFSREFFHDGMHARNKLLCARIFVGFTFRKLDSAKCVYAYSRTCVCVRAP